MTTQALTVRQEITPVANVGQMDIFKLGETLARSNYFEDAKDAAQAVVKILAGQELGFSPIASMTGIHIIKNKPVIGANLMAEAIKRRTNPYNYRIKEHSDSVCDLEITENGQVIGDSRFTIQDANNAGLTTGPNSHSWKKYPKNMLFARAISNAIRWHCPDVFNGVTVYTPEELDAPVNSDGELVHFPPTKAKLVDNARAIVEQQPENHLNAPPAEKQESQQEIRAREIMNQDGVFKPVVRRGNELVVTELVLGEPVESIVTRDENGKVRCDCAIYAEEIKTKLSFRCEHILAGKMFLVAEQKALEAAAQNNSPEDQPVF